MIRPWELREYSFEEFLRHIKGHELAQAYEWDRTRHIMFAVVKAAGAKGVKRVQDIMRLPVIDKVTVDSAVTARLKKRLAEFKQNNERSST